MKRKKIVGLVLCIILLIYFIGGIIYNFVLKEDKPSVKKEVNSLTIKGYDYLLYDNDLEIYKKEFKKLKNNLESDDINYLEYAYSISKMFIIDLYSLNTKNNKYDIGGVDFVHPDIIENYELNVTNTLNKYILDNTNGDRKQELPEVKNVNIDSDEEIKFTIGEEEMDAYKINLSIEYVKDFGYDNKAELIIIKSDKYLYIVEKN